MTTKPKGRPRLTPEQREASTQKRREYEHKPERMAAKREHMKRYNQRPDVVARRLWYYDNIALPRMCGIK